VVNRSHNRTRGDIIAQMLTLLEKPQLKTAVMYDCRLSHAQLKRYFRILVEKGLAREEEGKWIISEKGKVYLSAYKTAAKMIEE
jgi:predicted transcriptional regulator